MEKFNHSIYSTNQLILGGGKELAYQTEETKAHNTASIGLYSRQ